MDQTRDTGYTQLHEITRMYGELPEYVKSASLSETLCPEGLSSFFYADTIGKRFPIHTKAACYVSHMYFMANKGKITNKVAEHYIATRLSDAADNFGIKDDITNLAFNKLAYEQEVSRIPDDAYMLPSEQLYPLRNPMEVQKAAAYLEMYRDEFPWADRQGMASIVLFKAAEFEIDLGDLDYTMNKMAGNGTYNPKEACQQLVYRAALIADSTGQAIFKKLGSTLESDPDIALNHGEVSRIAATIDAADRAFGIKYGNLVKRPEEFMCRGVFKEASAFLKQAVQTPTGSVYTYDQLDQLDREFLTDLFGEKAAEASEFGIRQDAAKIAAYLTSLSLREASLFDYEMASRGLTPVREVATKVAISQDQRKQLAAEYAKS